MTRTAYNLNLAPFPFLMPLSAMLAAALVFSPRLYAAEAGHPAAKRSLDFDCDKRFISQRQASWLLGTDNFSQTYARRTALYAEIARACEAGVTTVRVEGKQATVPVTRLSRR